MITIGFKTGLSSTAMLVLAALLLLAQPVFAAPYVGEIRWVGFDYAPQDWELCNGATLEIASYQELFAVIGTKYGGDGVTTFKLPDLRGRGPIHASSSHLVGQMGGEESHILTLAEMPGHSHDLKADPQEGNSADNSGQYPAKSSSGVSAYGSMVQAVLFPGSITIAGSGAAHANMKPFVAMTCIIATAGTVPIRP